VNRRLAAIELRRAHLLERAARERGDVAQALQAWAQPLAFADRCIESVRFVISRPPLLAGAAFVLALLRPRRAFKWARRGFALWQGYRWLNRKIAL
jgi:hypothetical protein